MSWKLYEGDCLEVMPTLQDDSFDLIILDPPYNINKAEWDKIGSHTEYLSFIECVMCECERLLKDNGSLYLWHNQFPVLCDFQYLINNNTDFVFKQMLTWEKFQTNKQYFGRNFLMGFNNENKRNYHLMAEYCLFYTFQDETGLTTVKLDLNNFTTLRQYFKDFQEALGLSLPEINRILGHRRAEHGFYWKSTQWELPIEEVYHQLCELPLKNNKFVRREYEDLRCEYEDLRCEYEDLRREYEDLRYTFNMEKDTSTTFLYPPEKKNGHLTPKSIPLTTKLIRHSSNLDDNILIPFAGSGSEMIASINLNRNVIGIEQNPQYCQLIRERLHETTSQTKLTNKKPVNE